MKEALVKFRGYGLNSLQLAKLEKKHNKKNVKGDLELKSSFFQSSENKNMYMVLVNVATITNTHDITMSLEGYFEFDPTVERFTRDRFLTSNAPAILYPYCRSFISMISSFDSESAVILPVIDFSKK